MLRRNQYKSAARSGGFTFIELMVVLALIATIAVMALPQLLPVLIYSTHEGAARHLANYGRSAIAHASFTRETLTVTIDLDTQQYWSSSLPKLEETEDEDDMFSEDDEFPEDDSELFEMAQEELNLPQEERSDEGDDLIDEQTSRMASQFNDRSQRSLRARAERVVHDQRGILQGTGNLLGDEFQIGPDGAEIEPQEITGSLLQRTRLPEGVYIEYVKIGDVHYVEETVEIELTPLGLGTDVEFSLVNEDGDVLTVTWDPVTGNAKVSSGGNV